MNQFTCTHQPANSASPNSVVPSDPCSSVAPLFVNPCSSVTASQ